MPDLLTNPGFESGDAGWTLPNPLGAQAQTGGDARTGTGYLLLQTGKTLAGVQYSGSCEQTINVTAGSGYALSAWVKPISNLYISPNIRLIARDSSGSETVLDTVTFSEAPGAWTQLAANMTATEATVTVIVRTDLATDISGAYGIWYVDDCSAQSTEADEVSVRGELFTKLVDRLALIDGTGVYETNPTKYQRLTALQNSVLPAVMVTDEEDEWELLGFRRIRGEMTVTIVAASQKIEERGSSTQSEIDDLVDDVERAIGGTPSVTLPISGANAQWAISRVRIFRGVEAQPINVAEIELKASYSFPQGTP